MRSALGRIHVQPVLTAHPTEAKRPAVLERLREIYLMLVERENPIRTTMERQALHRRLDAAIERLWRTGEILLERPDVESEIGNVLHYISSSFQACCNWFRNASANRGIWLSQERSLRANRS
jgi:phosphoenolpyruvate carboxylase